MTGTHGRITGDTLSRRSLRSVVLTVVLSAVTHAYEFGPIAFLVGAAIVAVLWSLVAHYRQTRRTSGLVVYGLLNLWVIAALGVVGGFWNHAVKAVVVGLHGGSVHAGLERTFMSPELGSVMNESAGILTFAASLMAAYHGYRFARAVIAK